MKKSYSVKELQSFLIHTIKNLYFSQCIPDYFKSNQDIKEVYSIIRTHYFNNSEIATKSLIFDLLKHKNYDIQLSLLNTILDDKNYLIDIKNEEFFKKKYKTFLEEKQLEYKILSGIELMRDGDIDDKTKELYGISVELDNYDDDDEVEVNDLKNTKYFEESMYNLLPDTLKEMTSYFTDRERDIYFLSQITAISGLLNIKSTYYSQEVYPNLYCFIAAPAASGKSVVKFSKKTLNKIQKEMFKRHQIELQKWDSLNKEDKLKTPKPVDKTLYVSGNSSSAGLIKTLVNNNQRAIMFETEADTFADSKKQDWGDYSSLMRQAFHHEEYSVCRVSENIYLDKIKLSINFTGTLDQLLKIIPNREDGLSSRFMYYLFSQESRWTNPFTTNNNLDLTSIFENKYGDYIYELYGKYNNDNYIFNPSNDIKEELNKHLESMYYRVMTYECEEYNNLVNRLGLIAWRLLCIISTLRTYDANDIFNNSKVILSTKDDLDIVISITNTLLNHSLLVYNNLSMNNKKEIISDKKEEIFKSLPNSFTRAKMLDEFKKYKISESSLTRFISQLKKAGKINKIDKFNYEKILK